MAWRLWRKKEKTSTTVASTNQEKADSEWFLYPKSLAYSGHEWISIPSTPKLKLTTDMTMMAWIYPTIYGDQRIFCKSTAGDDQSGFGIDTCDLTLRFLGSNPSGINCFSSHERLKLHIWQHVACTFTNSTLKLYINGQLVGEKKSTGPLIPNDFPLVIGNSPVGSPSNGPFKGQMTQMSLWNIALTQEQIVEYKDKWLSNQYKGLVLYYPFVNNDASDFSGNGLEGIIMGSRTMVQVKQLGSLPWSREHHSKFPKEFRDAVKIMLMAHNKKGNVFSTIPKEIISLIVYNMSV